jgi:HPt (histidine-containing phosphotransfer) domain-containing protein
VSREIGADAVDHSPFVDLDAFRLEMREAGIEEVVEPTVQAYLQEVPDRVRTLEKALEAGDLEGVARAAHAMKSAAGVIRARTFSQMLGRLELAGYDGDAEAVVTIWEQARNEGQAVADFLRQEVESEG